MNIADAVAFLDQTVPDPSAGLPDALFFFISRKTPMVNVDLLIQDETGRTLLSWRDDRFCGRGWHIPGGIVRFKETLLHRVRKVGELEIGATVPFDPQPIAVNEIIAEETETRGHFISFLYRCRLRSSFVPRNGGLRPDCPGFLQWHRDCPADLISYQDIYREFIG